MSAVDVAGQVRDGFAFVSICRVCHAWVEVVEFDAEFLAALEVVDEGVKGLFRTGWVCVCKIDQVGAVWYNMFVLIVRVVLTVGVEAIGGFGQQGWVDPFALRFEEEGECVGADVDTVEWGVLDAWTCGVSWVCVWWKRDDCDCMSVLYSFIWND